MLYITNSFTYSIKLCIEDINMESSLPFGEIIEQNIHSKRSFKWIMINYMRRCMPDDKKKATNYIRETTNSKCATDSAEYWKQNETELDENIFECFGYREQYMEKKEVKYKHYSKL